MIRQIRFSNVDIICSFVHFIVFMHYSKPSEFDESPFSLNEEEKNMRNGSYHITLLFSINVTGVEKINNMNN